MYLVIIFIISFLVGSVVAKVLNDKITETHKAISFGLMSLAVLMLVLSYVFFNYA